MKCQNGICNGYCETLEEVFADMCGNCLESEKQRDKQREDDAKNLVELRAAMDLIRRAAGLSENLTPLEIASKVCERLANL